MPLLLSNSRKEKPHADYRFSLVTSREAAKPLATGKAHAVAGGYHPIRKIIATTMTALMVGVALLAGLFIPFSQEQAASANILEDMTCMTQNSDQVYLGGSLLGFSFPGSPANGPREGLIEASGPADSNGAPTGKWTLLEEVGYFGPKFTAWTGAYPGDNAENGYFGGTGGLGEHRGSLVQIADPQQYDLFSNSFMECFGTGGVSAGIGNTLLGTAQLITALSTETYLWATTQNMSNPDSALYQVGEGIEDIILGVDGQPGLKDALFLDFLVPLVIVASLGIFYIGIVKRSALRAGQGIIWVIAASATALAILTQPMFIPKQADNIVSSFTSAISGAISGDGAQVALCDIPNAGGNPFNGDKSAEREIACAVWYTTIYQPWVQGQFDIPLNSMRTDNPWMYEDTAIPAGNAVDHGVTSIAWDEKPEGTGWESAHSELPEAPASGDSRGVWDRWTMNMGNSTLPASQENWALYQLSQTMARDSETPNNISEVAYNQLVVNENIAWKSADNAIGSAGFALIGAIAPAAVFLTMGILAITFQISIILLVALAPIFLLAGIAPGWGRSVAMRWLEMIASLMVKRIALVLFVVIYAKLYSVVVSLQTLDWFFQTLLVFALTFAVLSQREKLSSIFTNAINFGGDKRIGDLDTAVNRGANKALHRANAAGATIARKGTSMASKKVQGAMSTIKDERNIAKAAKATTGKKEKEYNAARFDTDLSKDFEGLDLSQLRPEQFQTLSDDEHQQLYNADGSVNQEQVGVFAEIEKQRHQQQAEHLAAERERIREELAKPIQGIRGHEQHGKLLEEYNQIEASRDLLDRNLDKFTGRSRLDREQRNAELRARRSRTMQRAWLANASTEARSDLERRRGGLDPHRGKRGPGGGGPTGGDGGSTAPTGTGPTNPTGGSGRQATTPVVAPASGGTSSQGTSRKGDPLQEDEPRSAGPRQVMPKAPTMESRAEAVQAASQDFSSLSAPADKNPTPTAVLPAAPTSAPTQSNNRTSGRTPAAPKAPAPQPRGTTTPRGANSKTSQVKPAPKAPQLPAREPHTQKEPRPTRRPTPPVPPQKPQNR